MYMTLSSHFVSRFPPDIPSPEPASQLQDAIQHHEPPGGDRSWSIRGYAGETEQLKYNVCQEQYVLVRKFQNVLLCQMSVYFIMK